MILVLRHEPFDHLGYFADALDAPLYFTEAARRDRLFEDVSSPTTFFHWHRETFDLPAGAELLACSEQARPRHFVTGPMCSQFHPEVTSMMIADWCMQPVNCGDVTAPIDPYAGTGPIARQIVARWLELGRG